MRKQHVVSRPRRSSGATLTLSLTLTLTLTLTLALTLTLTLTRRSHVARDALAPLRLRAAPRQRDLTAATGGSGGDCGAG